MNDEPEKRFPIWAAREVDTLFSAFRRYTRFVFFSKWFLGVFALLLLVGLIGWPLLTKDKSGLRISFVGTDNTGVPVASPVMNNPQYQDTNEKSEQYKVTGLRAIQKTSELVIVEQMQGQLLHTDGSWVTMSAQSAEYTKSKNHLELIGNVTLSDSSGYTFTTPRATVNTSTMDIDGAETVEGAGPKGKILATGFKIRNNGNQISFGGTSRVNVHLDKMRQD